jgi:hypothetical protein
VKRGREITLFSRYENVLNKRFSGVVEALSSPGSRQGKEQFRSANSR